MQVDEPVAPFRRGAAVVLLAAGTVLTCAVLGAAGVLPTPAARAEAAAARPDPVAVAVAALDGASTDLVSLLSQPVADSAAPAPSVAPGPTRLVPTVLPQDSGKGLRIVYALADQRVWLVEADGAVSATYRVSGRTDVPAPGTYAVYSRSPEATGTTGQETVTALLRFAWDESGAIGFHTVPVDVAGVAAQLPGQLGLPLSGGGVRQSAPDAAALYAWAAVGTTVVVVP